MNLFKSGVLTFAGLLTPINPAVSQNQMDISPAVPMFCRDDSGRYQPIMRTNLGRVRDAFKRQFNFTGSLVKRSASTGVLEFRGGENNAETITFHVTVHQGGIALLDMKTRLGGVSENLIGSKMCWQTWSIVNVR